MKEIHGQAGEHISKTAARAIAAASANRAPVTLIFNDHRVEVSVQDTAIDVAEKYGAACEAAAAAWRNSPEGIARQQERQREIDTLQERHDSLMADLRLLDWSNDVEILDWLVAIQPTTDDVGVARRPREIIDTFTARGFKPNVNIGQDYRDDDRDNSFRYLVGQALSCLETVGAIHHILIKFAAEWKAKFAHRSEA